MERILPGLIIFITGFVTMAFEIIGSRVLGPYFGSSVFVWTSLIGVIMGSLSAGYWLGGLLSVKRNDFGDLVLILSISALFILITATANIYILDRVVKYFPGLRLQAVVASIISVWPCQCWFWNDIAIRGEDTYSKCCFVRWDSGFSICLINRGKSPRHFCCRVFPYSRTGIFQCAFSCFRQC